MAITKQDYKNIYSMLPAEKNEKGDSSLGLGKMVENLVPPFEEWVCEIKNEVPYAYFFLPVLKGMYQCQFFPTDRVDVVQMPLVSQKFSFNDMNFHKSSFIFKDSQHKIRCWFNNILYTKLNFEWYFKEDSSNGYLKISISSDNNILTIGNFTFRHENGEYYHWNPVQSPESWEHKIGSFALIYFENDFSSSHFLNYFFERSSSYTSDFPTIPSLRQFKNNSEIVLRVREPGSYLNTRSLFHHKEKRPLDLHLCIFQTNFPWVVDLNNTIIGVDLYEPYYQIEQLDKLEKEIPTQNIKSWFDSVDLEIGDDGLLYAINPLYENKDLLSSNTIIMSINGVEQSGEIKLIPNRLYLTSIEQNSNYVIRSNNQEVYKINQNTTRYLRQIYDKQKDTAENEQNKGGQNYNKPRIWVYWPQATIEQEKILLCTGNEIDGAKDNQWSDFRLLSKNDIKEENYTSIEYVWTFVYKDSENVTHYIMMGKSQPIIINKDSTNEIPLIQKNFGDEYYSNPYIFID